MRTQHRTKTYTTPGGLELEMQRPYLSWRCRPCETEAPVLRSCEAANPFWTAQQNAALLWHWAKQQEPSGDELTEVAHVDHAKLPGTFQTPLRKMVAEERRVLESWLQLGGPGVDVEIDEVSFRWRKAAGGGSVVDRFVCLVERNSRKMLLIELPQKVVAIGGKCGAITNVELYAVIFPRGRPPLLLPGTVVHTDSAKAYRNLAWTGSPATEVMPQDLAELLVDRPSPWRWESQEEATERQEAEAAEELHTVAGRTEVWASRYRHLRLVHCAVVHKKKPGKKRQFVVMRRCHFQEEDAEAVRAKGDDPWLVGNVSWRKGGTQKVDGYWRLLRKRVAYRSSNARYGGLSEQASVHQWSHALGPGGDLFAHLGATFQERRRRTLVDLEVYRRAWEEVGEEEEEANVPEHVHAGMRAWVEQVWRREAAASRGSKRALEVAEEASTARKRLAKTAVARSRFAANAAWRRAQAAQAALAAAQARAAEDLEAAEVAAEAAVEEAEGAQRLLRQSGEAADAAEAARFDAVYAACPATPPSPPPQLPPQPPQPPPQQPQQRPQRPQQAPQPLRLPQPPQQPQPRLRLRTLGESLERNNQNYQRQRTFLENRAQERFNNLQLLHPGTEEHKRQHVPLARITF